MLVRSGGVDIIVIDSVAALVPKAEIEGEMGDQLPGLQARLMSQALRKLTGNIKRANTLVIFINQIRMKIGVMFGNPETTTGGNALKFYASVRLDIRRIGAIKKGEEVVGNETRVKVVKNKVAPPFREALFDILYGEGISREGEIIELGVTHRIVEKSGAWYAYNGEKIGQGKDNAREFLREHPEIAAEIEAKIRAAVDVPTPGRISRAPRTTSSRRDAPRARGRPAASHTRTARDGAEVAAAGVAEGDRDAHARAARVRPRRARAAAARRAARARDDVERALDELDRARATCPMRATRSALVAQKTGRYGKRAIVHALKERGVDADAARRRAGAARRQSTSSPMRTALWQRRFGAPPRDEREKARQVRFLLVARLFAVASRSSVLRARRSAAGRRRRA